MKILNKIPLSLLFIFAISCNANNSNNITLDEQIKSNSFSNSKIPHNDVSERFYLSETLKEARVWSNDVILAEFILENLSNFDNWKIRYYSNQKQSSIIFDSFGEKTILQTKSPSINTDYWNISSNAAQKIAQENGLDLNNVKKQVLRFDQNELQVGWVFDSGNPKDYFFVDGLRGKFIKIDESYNNPINGKFHVSNTIFNAKNWSNEAYLSGMSFDNRGKGSWNLTYSSKDIPNRLFLYSSGLPNNLKFRQITSNYSKLPKPLVGWSVKYEQAKSILQKNGINISTIKKVDLKYKENSRSLIWKFSHDENSHFYNTYEVDAVNGNFKKLNIR